MILRILAGAAALALSVGWAGSAPAQITHGVVRVGVLTDMSGTYSDIGGQGSVVAAQMAVADFGGTVLGKPIEILAADHQNKADVASNIARDWIDVHHVGVITDLLNSSVALAVQALGARTRTITINSGAATTRLTGEDCTPYGFHWVYDTYALANGTARAVLQEGGDTWFFITADYAFGHSLRDETAAVVRQMGGRVLGSVLAPFPTADFASFLLQAQSSRAKVIGLANAGQDTINAIKQAHEFGITDAGQQLAGLLVFITDIHSLGLETAQRLYLTTAFYWDLDDATRAWSQRFYDRVGRMPTMLQAGVYSSVRHYLRAVQAAGTDEPQAVVRAMYATPIDDMFARNAHILRNGRMIHDMYLAQVKTPAESTRPWDYYRIVRTIPAAEAFKTLATSGCPVANYHQL